MDYTFQIMNFSNHKKMVRIRFQQPEYQGIERFFNDDAKILFDEIEPLLSNDVLEESMSFAGNRCVITLNNETVMIEDQWDEEQEGVFETVTLNKPDFYAIFMDWKSRL